MLTMKDIAKIANTSVATVSRALNDKPDINPKTKQRILQIIEEYDYVPNSVARSLFTKTSKVVGLIVPDLMNLYFPQIVQSIERQLNEYGYNVMLFNTLNRRNVQDHHIRMISNMALAGLVLITPNQNANDFLKLDLPLVTIDGSINEDIPEITSDFYNGARQAVRELHNNNCKKLMHIAGPLIYPSSIERYKGFVDQCMELGIPYDIVQTELDGKDQQRIYHYIESHETDGIFAANDSLAFTAIRVLGSLSIKTPEKIKIIGYDNNFMANSVNPPLSTIAVPIEEVGRQAVKTLYKMINKEAYDKRTVFDCTYIRRHTTFV